MMRIVAIEKQLTDRVSFTVGTEWRIGYGGTENVAQELAEVVYYLSTSVILCITCNKRVCDHVIGLSQLFNARSVETIERGIFSQTGESVERDEIRKMVEVFDVAARKEVMNRTVREIKDNKLKTESTKGTSVLSKYPPMSLYERIILAADNNSEKLPNQIGKELVRGFSEGFSEGTSADSSFDSATFTFKPIMGPLITYDRYGNLLSEKNVEPEKPPKPKDPPSEWKLIDLDDA